MVSLSAEEDRANLKHKAALRTQLEATVLHLLRVAVADSEPEPEPEPEAESEPEPEPGPGPGPELGPDGQARQVDKDSPSVRDCISLWPLLTPLTAMHSSDTRMARCCVVTWPYTYRRLELGLRVRLASRASHPVLCPATVRTTVAAAATVTRHWQSKLQKEAMKNAQVVSEEVG